jgi:AbiV family abortive infection protein
MNMPDLSFALNAKPFKGKLFPHDASQTIDAARNAAAELLKTAEILFEQERYARCVSMSILAMEEAAKREMLLSMLLGWADIGAGWKEYVRHLAKTRFVNDAIPMQIRNYSPHMTRQDAYALGKAGPTPDTLDKTKQRAIYSDCLDKKGRVEIHDPSTIDWKAIAYYLLCDARVIVGTLRHYSAA